MSIRTERLRNWIESLSGETIKSVLLECVSDLIDLEEIKFYDDSPAPYWNGNGEYIDGREYEDE